MTGRILVIGCLGLGIVLIMPNFASAATANAYSDNRQLSSRGAAQNISPRALPSSNNFSSASNKAIGAPITSPITSSFNSSAAQTNINNSVQNNADPNQEDALSGSGNILNDSQAGNVDDLSKNGMLEKEIQVLNQELDGLHKKLDDLQNQNKQLQINLDKYQTLDQKVAVRNKEIAILSQEARDTRNLIGTDAPSAYANAHNLLIVGNIDFAQQQFIQFLKDNPNSTASNLYTGQQNSPKYQALANYWLGRISNINGNYNDAVNYFSQTYKLSDPNKTALMALIGLTTALTQLANKTAACTTIKQFYQDYQVAAQEEKITLDNPYLQLIATYKQINQCS